MALKSEQAQVIINGKKENATMKEVAAASKALTDQLKELSPGTKAFFDIAKELQQVNKKLKDMVPKRSPF